MSVPDVPVFWWRVEIDARGGVVSCARVDEERAGTARVAYVRGKTETEVARIAAREWHERHKRYQSISAKRLAQKRLQAGLCRHCDDAICEESTRLCKRHLEDHREYNRRHRRGESTPRVPADAVALREQHLADHRLRARLGEQLPELLRKYDELDGAPTAFRFWLEREIASREVTPLRLVSNE